MTKREALALFRETFPASVFRRNGYVDDPMRRETWNNFTDSLCKDGSITLKQYESWDNPF